MYQFASETLKAKKSKKQPKRRLETNSNLGGVEEETETMLLSICNPEEPVGKWMRHIDIVKAGNMLMLNTMPLGKCRRECRTIEKACNGVLDLLGDEDLSEIILEAAREKAGTAALGKHLCASASSVCTKGKTPLWPDSKIRKNEEFWQLNEEEIADEQRTEDAAKMTGPTGNPMKAYKLSVIPPLRFEHFPSRHSIVKAHTNAHTDPGIIHPPQDVDLAEFTPTQDPRDELKDEL